MTKRKTPVLDQISFADPMGIPLIGTDPFGSYTGRSEDPKETPVQDADDL